MDEDGKRIEGRGLGKEGTEHAEAGAADEAEQDEDSLIARDDLDLDNGNEDEVEVEGEQEQGETQKEGEVKGRVDLIALELEQRKQEAWLSNIDEEFAYIRKTTASTGSRVGFSSSDR